METSPVNARVAVAQLPKAPTGIQGVDEITGGGLPRGRPTLVCGGAGCGKTLLSVEFLVRGAAEFGEPGVFLAFEETAEELAQNVASLGFDLAGLIAGKQLVVDHVRVERAEIEETGEYDLEGLFIRLAYAIDAIGARRVVLDTVETLFSGLSNESILRAELRRLFAWLKERGVTAIITGERGPGGALTRYGLEEYISDCVITLDHRMAGQTATRHMRVVKYRGSQHGTNDYPFLIGERGISVLPITSLGLQHTTSSERHSSGVAALDAMLEGQGYYRGSSILVSGTAGSGKTSLAAYCAAAACARGERCLYFAFEEPHSQLMRNMRSIGLDLAPWVERGLLLFHASRPTAFGLEMHLASIHKVVEEFRPAVVVLDPITNFLTLAESMDVRAMLTRLIDYLKGRHVTALFTSLTHGDQALERTETSISSLIDTWLLVRDIELSGERNRGLYILKSRGMAHSNQIREFRLTSHGIELVDAYLGEGTVLTGSARVAQEAREQAESLVREQEQERRQQSLERKRQALEARIAALRAEFDAEIEEDQALTRQVQAQTQQAGNAREDLARSRKVRTDGGNA